MFDQSRSNVPLTISEDIKSFQAHAKRLLESGTPPEQLIAAVNLLLVEDSFSSHVDKVRTLVSLGELFEKDGTLYAVSDNPAISQTQ